MSVTFVEAVVIGAGHAGLSAGYYLKKLGIEHLIFERGKIGESWRSQRWDSFALNTSKSITLLPGQEYSGNEPHTFASAGQFVSSLNDYARKFQLPVREHVTVLNITRIPGENFFEITVKENDAVKKYRSLQVIICSGCQNTSRIPLFASKVPPGIKQLHASEYRNATVLPEGAVLVVGSAQSGCQVTEDLLDAGKSVFLSTCAVARIPRRYRGNDVVDWLIQLGFFDLRAADVTDPKIFQMVAPQVSGTGKFGHTVSLQQLARKGAVIIGKMENADQQNAYFMLNAHEHVKFGDEFSNKVKAMVDEFILKNQLVADVPGEDEADVPDPDAKCISPISSLDFKENNITSIVWTSGFGGDFTYIDLPVFDKAGNPEHNEGVSAIEGLYFLGLPWLRTRKSGVIFGIKEDAEYISNKVFQYARRRYQLEV